MEGESPASLLAQEALAERVPDLALAVGHQHEIAAAHLAHLAVEETVFEPMAAAYASVLPDERTPGVAVIDLGFDSTGLVIYDGDRCVLCDETGALLDGDEILTILALHALRSGKLAARTLVVTQQSNLGVDAALAAAGGRVCRTPVGDRYVMERMRAEGATLGGESSGHVICSDVAVSGDGLVAALKVIAVMLATGRPLSVLRQQLRKFPQRSSALRVKEKIPLEKLSALSAVIGALEQELGAQGRGLVRYSGTEPKLRLLVEGPTDAVVDAALARLTAAARAGLEVL